MKTNLNVQLLAIDPQNDFMDEANAALRVTGATGDMKRLAVMIGRIGKKLSDIHVTLDSHRVIDVGHPGFWRDQNGTNPAPFTMIKSDDVANGIWSPRDPQLVPRMLSYANELEKNGQYNIMVWPEHCLIGSPGHNVQPDLLATLQAWERSEYASINYVTKGTNIYTEHYGALQAEVPDPQDPDTSLNTGLLQMMQLADVIVVAGEASSHCVLSTVNQIADNIGAEHIKKFVLLTDCMSPVGALPGVDFPAIAKAWMVEMEKKGMKLATSVSFLA